MSTALGRVVFFVWIAMLLAVGVVIYLLRNSVDQSVGLLLIAALYVAHLALAPHIDRLARRRLCR
jgi:uncharacterized membrane protein YhaH (DUF805 family)